MAEEVAMRGASSVTVARVIARAGVSRRLFYELFADVEDCFLATFDWGVEQARLLAVDAYTAERSWREAIRAGLGALLRFFDERPLIAQLCVVHAAGGGPRVLERRSQVIAELCEVVDRGRAENSNPARPGRVPPPVVAEGVVGAVLAVLYTRMLARGAGGGDGATGEPEKEPSRLIELHGELMSLIVLPYLGGKVAGNELHKSAPPARPHDISIAPEPAGRLQNERPGARLTYRTVRVLMTIADLPGGSNREVAERAGIVDQGQISKLLTRLEYQGLIVNRDTDSTARGTPNSWWLTERGEVLERELREHPVGEGDAHEQSSGPRGSGKRSSGGGESGPPRGRGKS
jgi:AcrR family transcriptional regulator/DNA-binding MarR family transcriptional regulator